MNRRRKDNSDTHITELVAAYESGGVIAFFEPEAYLDLIDFYEEEEAFDKALEVARVASAQYRFSPEFYARQGQLLLQTKQEEIATEILEKALTFAPGDFELILLLGEAHIRKGDIKTGLACIAPLKSNAAAPDLSEILLVESIAYEKQEEYDHMFYALKAALEADAGNIHALNRIGISMELCRKHEEAAEVLQKVIDSDPYNSHAWFYLGQAHNYLRCYEQAREAFEYAFLTNPDFEEAYVEYADICFEEGLLQQALDIYQEVSKRFGSDSELLLRIGSCLHLLGQHETARRYLEQAARIEPHNDEVIFKIGECFAAQEKWTTALTFFQKAIRMCSDDEDYYQALAEAAFEVGDYDLAESCYYDALNLAPDNDLIWLDLAWFFLEMLQVKEALDTLAEARKVVMNVELPYAYAACLFANGRRQEALLQLSEALEEHYETYPRLFDWQPGLRVDAEVNALISLYRPTE